MMFGNQHEGLLATVARLASAIDSPAIDSGRVASLLPFSHWLSQSVSSWNFDSETNLTELLWAKSTLP